MLARWQYGVGLAAAVLWLAPVATATECYLTFQDSDWYNRTSYNFQTYFIDSQEALDARVAGCTTVIGNVYIASNYTGSFILRGVTNITGNVTTLDEWYPRVARMGIKGLSSIEMPDLVTIGSLYLSSYPPVKLLSFPKLEQAVHHIELHTSQYDTRLNVSFPALLNASEVYVWGNTSVLDFSSLRTVSRDLIIGSGISNYWSYSDKDPSDARAISFPALRTAGDVRFVGNISSVSVPLLDTITSSPPVYAFKPYGFTVKNSGDIIHVTAPKLRNATVVELTSGIGSFSFPSLIDLNGDFNLDIEGSMNISLFPLQTAVNVHLNGEFTRYNFTSLRDITGALYVSSLPLESDCTIVKNQWALMSHNASHELSSNITIYPELYCNDRQPYKEPKKPLSEVARMGIGLGVGISVMFLACLWNCSRIKKEAAKKKLLPPPEYELSENAVNRRRSEDVEGEPLPGYLPRGAPGIVVEDGGPVSETGGAPQEPPSYTPPAHPHTNAVDLEAAGGERDGTESDPANTRREDVRREG